MMAGSQFEIYRYNKNGDLVRRIRCLSRRITVFRALDKKNLQIFSSCLFGEHTEDRFSLIYDGESFHQSNKNIISERFSEKKNITVEELLKDIPSLESFLVEHGVGGISKLSLLEIAPWQREIVHIFAAAQDKISPLIIEDPFKEAPLASRNSVAEFLLEQVAKNDIIVVVTQLSNRPESWIDNEFVVRAQLEPPRKRTIGFGSGTTANTEAEVYHALNAIRKEGSTPKGKLLTGVAAFNKNTTWALIGGSTIGLVLGCSVLFLLHLATTTKNLPVESTPATSAVQIPPLPDQSRDKDDTLHKGEVFEPLALKQPKYLIDAWEKTFSGNTQETETMQKDKQQKWETGTDSQTIKSFYDEVNNS